MGGPCNIELPVYLHKCGISLNGQLHRGKPMRCLVPSPE